MPLLTLETDTGVADGRTIRLSQLPDFNAGDEAFKITLFDGWFSTADVDAVLVPNGGGAGAVASGLWLSKEMTYTLQGRIDSGRDTLELMRRLVIASLPAGSEGTIVCLGNGLGTDVQVFVRRYGRAEFQLRSRLDFTIPLVAPDPYKYALESLAGVTGVFTGESWYRTYTSGAAWYRAYAYNGTTAKWYRSYQQAAASGTYPESLALESAGDVASQRITFTVTGPLEAGDWWLLNETTNERLWANVALDAGESVVFDCAKKLATMGGSDISSVVYGSWLTLEPGANTYRLVAGTRSDAFATISALEAYL